MFLDELMDSSDSDVEFPTPSQLENTQPRERPERKTTGRPVRWEGHTISPQFRDDKNNVVLFEEGFDENGQRTGRFRCCSNSSHKDFLGRNFTTTGDVGSLKRQNFRKHITRHHYNIPSVRKSRKMSEEKVKRIRNHLITFMVDSGISMNAWKKTSFSNFLEVLTEEANIDPETIKKITPSARTIVREIKSNRSDTMQRIALFANEAAARGHLSVAIDHKSLKFHNESYRQCFGILLIVSVENTTEK